MGKTRINGRVNVELDAVGVGTGPSRIRNKGHPKYPGVAEGPRGERQTRRVVISARIAKVPMKR